MKCDICKSNTVIRKRQRHHYVESGLDNIYLDSIDVFACEACGDESPVIPRMTEVHAAIGRAVALQPVPLRGEDVRFLRKQLGLRARQWAGILKVSFQTLSRWENNEQKIGPQSDALFRLMYFRIREEREGRFLPGDIVDQITAVPDERQSVPILLVDVGTLKVTRGPSLKEMDSWFEREMAGADAEIHVSSVPQRIPAGRLQGVRESASAKPYNLAEASPSETDQNLAAMTDQYLTATA
jgi:putative zinc finger/helix-turn-helix YgiT family protein